MLSEEAREKQREYLREWRKRNKDKVRSYNAGYWERKADKENEKLEVGEDKQNGFTE